jgi:competence protein ComGC
MLLKTRIDRRLVGYKQYQSVLALFIISVHLFIIIENGIWNEEGINQKITTTIVKTNR